MLYIAVILSILGDIKSLHYSIIISKNHYKSWGFWCNRLLRINGIQLHISLYTDNYWFESAIMTEQDQREEILIFHIITPFTVPYTYNLSTFQKPTVEHVGKPQKQLQWNYILWYLTHTIVIILLCSLSLFRRAVL